MLRFLTAGESHGEMLVAVIDGIPAGLTLLAEHIDHDLALRQKGYGRSERMSIERDRARILSGVRFGKTLGSPIAIAIPNIDHSNWSHVMSVEPADEANLNQPITVPRPGHADLAGCIKYGHTDIRNVLERASGRETAIRTAVGAVARQLLKALGVFITSHVTAIGNTTVECPTLLSAEEIRDRSYQSPIGCIDKVAEKAMIRAIDNAAKDGDTLGGVFEIIATGTPIGIGSYSQWDERLDGMLAQAIMSIPGIKGIEIGLGFGVSQLPGSKVHDEIGYDGDSYTRTTNNAGGIEGGVSNGQPIIIRAAMKPIPTLTRQLKSVDMQTKEPKPAHSERSDVCAVPSAAIVGEAMTAITLATAVLDKFGGDSMEELSRNIAAYTLNIAAYTP